MTDPFLALQRPDEPVAPDPHFAAELRARLERALTAPKGVAVSSVLTTVPTATPRPSAMTREEAAALPYPTLLPYLAVADARAAIAWYVDVLGAVLRADPIEMPDGRIGHAELAFGDAVMMLADAHPEIGHVAPTPGGVPVSLHWDVDSDADVGRIVDSARAGGATITHEPTPSEYGYRAGFDDPFGHRWMLSATAVVTPAPAPVPRHGDVGYASLQVPDGGRAAAFYGHVLGWAVVAEGGRHRIYGHTIELGIFGGEDEPTLFCAYAVDDVDAAVERVRAAGGTATTPDSRPYGRLSDVVDDQGVALAIYEPPGGVSRVAAPVNGERQGDISYLTHEVVDSAKARAFYGSVLGWTFRGGRIDDGWEPEGVSPMSGLSGGHEHNRCVPMFRVDDIHAAVARVREAGGTSTEVEPQPYGLSATCIDDQATKFYLGQH